jgi:hypothetical protein
MDWRQRPPLRRRQTDVEAREEFVRVDMLELPVTRFAPS